MIHRTRLDEHDRLPADAAAAYARDGILVIEDFVAPARCAALRERALALVAEHAPHAGGTVFSTSDQRHARDAYFEASANRIGAFFEAGAFDADGRLQVPLERAVNKLGHALHDLDPVFDAFSRGPRLQAVADAVGLTDPRLVQSMYILSSRASAAKSTATRTRPTSTPNPNRWSASGSRSRTRTAETAASARSPASIGAA